MTRTIKPVSEYMSVQAWTEPLTLHTLATEAKHIGAGWLLAHADDGLIWGRVDNDQLIVPEIVQGFSIARLNETTLQRLWLFGKEGEAFLWRDDTDWQHRRITRSKPESESELLTEAIDEHYMLYGTHSEGSENGFTLVRDGQQGLRHAFPMEVELDTQEPERQLKLKVRHYVRTNKDGFSYIALSRLVSLKGSNNAKQK